MTVLPLPVGALSNIISDTDGLHIVRVIERVPAHRTPFRDAQVEIEKKIRKQQRKEKLEKYYARLRREIRIWTVFDDTANAAKPSQF